MHLAYFPEEVTVKIGMVTSAPAIFREKARIRWRR
jgi:hypothetical protein